MKGRRVVVTGVGCVTPIGNDRAQFTEGLRLGRSGVARIRLFDPETLPVAIAAEVKDFDPSAHLPAKDLKHVARVVPLSLAASQEAFTDAGIDVARLTLSERRGISVV